MSQRELPGSIWRAATGEFAINVPDTMVARYGSALDLLTIKTRARLWDVDTESGGWRPRGNEESGHSLAYLAFRLIEASEKAREEWQKAKKTPAKTVPAGRNLTSAKRRKLVREARSVATFLRAGGRGIYQGARAASRFITPSPISDEPLPPDLGTLAANAWHESQRRLSAGKLADALTAFADELAGHDFRTEPIGRGEGVETALASKLVTWLRVATGATWDRQPRRRPPSGGRPFYEVAAAFVEAAGWSMPASVLKQRLEAKIRA